MFLHITWDGIETSFLSPSLFKTGREGSKSLSLIVRKTFCSGHVDNLGSSYDQGTYQRTVKIKVFLHKSGLPVIEDSLKVFKLVEEGWETVEVVPHQVETTDLSMNVISDNESEEFIHVFIPEL